MAKVDDIDSELKSPSAIIERLLAREIKYMTPESENFGHRFTVAPMMDWTNKAVKSICYMRCRVKTVQWEKNNGAKPVRSMGEKSVN